MLHRYRGGSKSLSVPRIFVSHTKYAKRFHNPTVVMEDSFIVMDDASSVVSDSSDLGEL